MENNFLRSFATQFSSDDGISEVASMFAALTVAFLCN